MKCCELKFCEILENYFKSVNFSIAMNLTNNTQQTFNEPVNDEILYDNEIRIINDKQDYISIVLSNIFVFKQMKRMKILCLKLQQTRVLF